MLTSWSKMLLLAVIGVFSLQFESRGQTVIEVDATQIRSINGTTELDRARYFNFHGTLVPPNSTNIGPLVDNLVSPDHLHASTGRTSTEFDQFICSPLPEDPANPGFLNTPSLIQRLRANYRDFIVFGSRWRTLRDADNPFLINAGRSTNFWPDFMRTDPDTGITSNFYPNLFGYIEFFKTYLDEVVYGSNAFLPIPSERMWIEILNEPELHVSNQFTWNDMINYHETVSLVVKAFYPEAKIVGPSLAITDFHGDNFARWNSTLRPFIEGAGAEMDAYSYHPYERYSGRANGTYEQDIRESPGKVQSTIDLIQNYNQNFYGELKPLAITEYGSFQRWDVVVDNEPFIGMYARDLQQWDMVRNIKEKMWVFLQHPHLILNAVPFVSARDFRGDVPTNAFADNVIYEQDSSGDWRETIVAGLFRTLSKIDGDYIQSKSPDPDLQVVSLRDGDQVFIMLNNLETTTQTIDLQIETGDASVVSATMDRIFRQSGTNQFVDNEDILNSLPTVTLQPEEGAVITLTLSENQPYTSRLEEDTYYGTQTVVPINTAGTSGDIPVDLDTTGATFAQIRVSFTRPGFTPGETFFVVVNDSFSRQVNVGELAFDDQDYDVYSRTVEVPAILLNNGINNFDFHFSGNGGHVASVVVTLLREIPVGPQTTDVNDLVVSRGESVGGGLEELSSSDDSRYRLRPVGFFGPGNPSVQFEATGTLSTTAVSQLSLNIESMGATPNLIQNVEMFNWNSEQFELVNSSTVTVSDSSQQLDLNAGISNYVNSITGQVRTRVNYLSGGPVLLFPWSVGIDRITWSSEN